MAIIAISTGCTAQKVNINAAGKDIVGNGNIVKKEFSASGFNKIDVMSALNIYLIQSGSENVVVETDEHIIDYIDISVRNGILFARFKDNCKSINVKKLNIYVNFKDLQQIQSSGSCKIFSEGKSLIFNELTLNFNGSSEGKLEFDCKKLTMLISGASKLDISGKVENSYINLSGASALFAKDLIIDNCKIAVSGASTATINANNSLEIEARHASKVYYYGTPAHTNFETQQSSSIKQKH
ncbi:MAG: DUF2807 domain-containing protein [Prevotellaceae bacterium]|nr:DUF2807 domain-containing protein [Prevotellaceae bacterium]